MSSSLFKVIVAGGGPVGLIAAHALSRAGIDFLVLEQRSSPIVKAGNILVLGPLGLRALDQLGLQETLKDVTVQLSKVTCLDHQGRDIGEYAWFEYEKKFYGVGSKTISRQSLTEILYNSLSPEAKSKILTQKKVSDVNATDRGVRVSCADGSSYEASVLIGADGVHSAVRNQMRKLALWFDSSDVNDEQPFLTTYRALWFNFPSSSAAPLGTAAECHGHGASTQMFAGKETSVAAIYERLDKPTRERLRYTEQDEQNMIKRWGHLPIVKNGALTVKEAYETGEQRGLVSLEEGVLKHWSWAGRIVLVGDSAHKFTPSTGAGYNNGIVDVAALANELIALLKKSPEGVPGKVQLAEAFKAYQEKRFAAVTDGCHSSAQATALATWKNSTLKFADRFVMPRRTVQKFLVRADADVISQSPSFNFTGGTSLLDGKLPKITSVASA